jgi:6-phosphogluconolactonase (cycloisomerase 2 family)
MAEDAVQGGLLRSSPQGSRNFWKLALRPLAAGAVAGMVLLSGCGDFFNPPATSTGTTTTTTYAGDSLFVANSNTLLNSVADIEINSGVFSSPTTSPYVLNGGSPTALAITPNNAFLYVASGVLNTGIYEYALNSDGSLTAENSGAPQAVATALVPSAIVVDPSGQWLIAFQSSGSTGGTTTANVFAIDSSTGALSNPTTGAEQVAIDTGSVGQVVFNPASTLNAVGTVLYVTLGAHTGATGTSGGVDILGFDPSTGALQLNGNLPPVDSAGAAAGVAIHPAGTYLFVTETGNITGTTGGGNGVRSLQIVSGGQLSLPEIGAYQTGQGAGAVLVDATGAYLYVANRADSTISAFSISSTAGTLAQIGTAVSSVGSTPVAMVEDNSKTYIGVACEGGSPDLQLFTFDATTLGQLDASSSGSLSTGSSSPAGAVAIVATH